MDLTNTSKNAATLTNNTRIDQRYPAIADIAIADASVAGEDAYTIATVLTNISKNLSTLTNTAKSV